VKDRHIMMLAVLAVFIGAMLFISELASNPAVASSRNQQTIPDELSTELDMSTPENPSTPDTTAITEVTEEKRLDTLLEQMSEISDLLDEVEQSRTLIASANVK
jgi:hypothetical protein